MFHNFVNKELYDNNVSKSCVMLETPDTNDESTKTPGLFYAYQKLTLKSQITSAGLEKVLSST